MILHVLDIGGSKMSAACWQPDGGKPLGHLFGLQQAPMPKTQEAFEQQLRDLLLALREHGGPADGIAAAATGFTDGACMHSVNRNTIAFWNDYPLQSVLQRECAGPVLLVNDAQAAAWGEYVARVQVDAPNLADRDLLFVTLSTGVGAGVVLDGQLRRGPGGLGGHLGHMSCAVQPLDGWQACGCGQSHCLESLASGTALARQASHLLGRSVSSPEIFALLRSESPEMKALIAHAATGLASTLASVRAMLDVSLYVLGGSVGLQPDMQAALQQALDRLPSLFHLRVCPAENQALAGLVGAAHLWASDRERAPAKR